MYRGNNGGVGTDPTSVNYRGWVGAKGDKYW